MKDSEFCAYFQDIEADPSATPPNLTVMEFLQARQHILVCEDCRAIVDRVCEADERRGQEPFSVN